MAFFRLREVVVEGTRVLPADTVLARLAADTTMSLWDDFTPLERSVLAHPQVSGVTFERRMPGTLVVRVEENAPIAFLDARGGLQALDARGRSLPIDPSRTPVDLPVIATRDTTLLALLARVRAAEPALYGRISEARRVGRDEVVLQLATVPVRAMADVDARRLADLHPVEQDLARRQARVAELDLRYRDQVIARLQ
jgi:cell division septal protein FtsQ